MKFRIASDLHLEFYNYKSLMSANGRDMNEYHMLPYTDDEKKTTLILAGDISNAVTIHHWELFFKGLSNRFHQIIVVMGNHEHYSGNFLESFGILDAFFKKFPNITLLDNQMFTDNDSDCVIFGATLWTDMRKSCPLSMSYAQAQMPDYKIIHYGPPDHCGSLNPLFTPSLSVSEHEKTIKHLKDFIKYKTDKKKVVVTHHAPSYQSVSEKYRYSILNPAFVSNLDNLIHDSGINMWVHGHVHQPHDYTIGQTHIVCNPYGYQNENPHYNPTFTLTI